MTEADYFDALGGIVSNGFAAYAVFVSLVGGYLVAAYNVGSKLDRSQMWIINCLYLASVLFVVITVYGMFSSVDMLAAELAELNPKRYVFGFSYATEISLAVNLTIVLSSLKFMYDIRKKSQGST